MLPVISLLVLVAVILISAWKKVNPGLLGIVAAFILGFFVMQKTGAGVEIALSSPAARARVLIAGFNYSLWFTIMAVSLFFAIANENRTMEIITNKVITLIRGKNKLLPIVFYFLTFAIAAIGAGSIGVLILIMPIAAAVAYEQKLDFLLIGVSIGLAAGAGGISPLAFTGIIATNLGALAGITVTSELFIRYFVCCTITVAILYVVLGGWKIKDAALDKIEMSRKMNTQQLITLISILVFAVATVGFSLDVGFSAFTLSVLLFFLNKVDEKKVVAMIPWSTLILLCGMGILINVVDKAGGMKLLTQFFMQFVNKETAGPIINIVAGLMSFVASASGVVLPTLIPTVPGIAAATGASSSALLNAISFGAHQTAISPFSTGGSLILSMSGENIDQQKTFWHLIISALCALAVGSVYSFLGMLG